jgi:hypothetical protein
MRFLRVLQVVVVACGCGGNAGHLPDAGAPIDGATDSGSAPPVTLTVTRNAQPVVGVHVYFLNPDDTVVAKIDTDATGNASAVVANGGSVTVLDAFAPAQPDPARALELRTYAGVKAGDHLTVSQRDNTPIDVTIKAPLLSGRHSYDVLTTCGTSSISSAQASGTVTLSGCHGIADILVTATGIGTTDRFALYHASVPVADGGTVDLTTDTFVPLRDVTFHYSHVPSDAQTVSVLHGFVTEHGTIGFNGVVFDGTTSSIQQGEATITFPVPDLANIENVSALIDYTIDMHIHHGVREHRPLAASFDLDVSGLLLPDRSGQAAYDAANRRLVWVDAPGGIAPDLDLGILAVTPAPTRAAAPTQPWSWQVIAPHTGAALQLPALPADVNTWVPAAVDTVNADVLALKVPGGYDAIRGRVYDEAALDTFERQLRPGERILKTEN